MNLNYPQKSPARFVPVLARLYGIQCNPMLMYCATVKPKNKLPRGLEVKCERIRIALRKLMLNRKGEIK